MATRIINYFDKTDEGIEQLSETDINMALKTLVNGRYRQTIEKIYENRTDKQNNALWAIPYEIMQRCIIEVTGAYISKKEMHETIAMPNCLPKDYIERIKKEWEDDPGIVNKKTGQVIKPAFRLTSTKMTTVEMMKYYQNLQDFLWEMFEAECPDPDPLYKFRK